MPSTISLRYDSALYHLLGYLKNATCGWRGLFVHVVPSTLTDRDYHETKYKQSSGVGKAGGKSRYLILDPSSRADLT